MQTRLSKIFILFLVVSMAMAACEDVVEVDLNDEDLDLVSVEAYISTKASNNVVVKLEKSLPVNQPVPNPGISGATVEIWDDRDPGNRVTLREVGSTGIYRLPPYTIYRAVPGRTYHLKITTPDGVVISGSDYLQEVEPLDSVKVNLSARGDYQFLAIFISAPNYPGPIQYYKWDIYHNNDFLNESYYLFIVNDELVDGNYVYDFEIFTDFHDPSEPDDALLNIGDTIYVEQLSISKNVYDFYLGMMNQAFSGSPYSVPPANLPGNLTSSDGKTVLGMFSARDISEGNTVIIDSTNYVPLTSGYNFPGY